MSSNTFGEVFKITTFGESHGKWVGVVIDGVKPGIKFDVRQVQKELDRRRPGVGKFRSARREPDKIEVASGIFDGITTGAPICILVKNRDVRSNSYEKIKHLFRPGHGDWTWLKKYGIRDWRGGGRLSGRETVGRVVAGGFAKQLLKERGIHIYGFVKEVGGVKIKKFIKDRIETDPLLCPDPEASKRMRRRINQVVKDGDSLGGVIEVRAEGVPPGVGDPVFYKLDARIAWAVMSIGAVKAVEIGDGLALARVRGSESNDQMTHDGFISNRAGGIVGGISTGQPIIVRAAVKPTPSIKKPQKTIDIKGNSKTIKVSGRHDPVIAPRAVVVAESMVAIVLLDAILRQESINGKEATIDSLRQCIDKCDEEIIDAIYRRIQIAKQIGKLKKKKSIKITDLKRQSQVLKRIKLTSKELGLPVSQIEEVFRQIISMSKAAQQE